MSNFMTIKQAHKLIDQALSGERVELANGVYLSTAETILNGINPDDKAYEWWSSRTKTDLAVTTYRDGAPIMVANAKQLSIMNNLIYMMEQKK